MHPFTLSRPADISAAISAHAHDAHLAFIAGGTDLTGLNEGPGDASGASVRHQPLA
jgi:CO/xanthine dehydrogenase FAD-binding subunit